MAPLVMSSTSSRVDLMAKFLTQSDAEKVAMMWEAFSKKGGRSSLSSQKKHRSQASAVFIAKTPDAGIPALVQDTGTGNADEPGAASCDIYRIDSSTDPHSLVAIYNVSKTVYNLSASIITQEWVLIHKTKSGKWVTSPDGEHAPVSNTLVGCKLTEDHPGTSIPFQILVGTWDADSNYWYYSGGNTYTAIDHRVGAPAPIEGAEGLGIWRESTTYGVILEIVDLDCTSPGTGTGTGV